MCSRRCCYWFTSAKALSPFTAGSQRNLSPPRYTARQKIFSRDYLFFSRPSSFASAFWRRRLEFAQERDRNAALLYQRRGIDTIEQRKERHQIARIAMQYVTTDVRR